MKPAPPYRFPQEDVLRAGPWTLEIGGENTPLPALLPAWDYATDLSLERVIEVELHRAVEESGLDGAQLAVAVLWRSTASELRGPGAVMPLEDDGECRLRVELRGSELGGTLELETVLILARAVPPRARVASRAGSVLWRDRQQCRLQGDAPMFPIEIVDFDAMGFDARSPWHLEVRDDLDSFAMGAIHLLVNQAASGVVEAVANAAAPNEPQSRILSAMYADVGRTLSEYALSHVEFDTDGTYEPETLGALLKALLASTFPGRQVAALRRARQADVARWASESNAAFGLFADR